MFRTLVVRNKRVSLFSFQRLGQPGLTASISAAIAGHEAKWGSLSSAGASQKGQARGTSAPNLVDVQTAFSEARTTENTTRGGKNLAAFDI